MRAAQIINSIPNWVWMLLLFTVALSARLLCLTSTDIAGDEPFSIFFAQLEPAFIIEFLSKGNNPPLFELILHYWMNMVGNSDYLLRLLPAIFGALTVIPVYLIGERFFSRQIGFVAAILFTFSTWNIRFAHEVRVYSLLTLLAACSIWFFMSVVKHPKKNRNWALLGLTWILMLYSHYVSVYIIGTQIILGVFFVPKENFKRAIVLLAALFLAYLPNILVLLARLDEVVESGGTWVQPPGWGEIYGSVNLMLNDRLVSLVLILILMAGFLLTKTPRISKLTEIKQPVVFILIGLLFLIPYLSQFFISKWFIPMFTDRYILYTSVPLYLSVAWGVDHLWSNSKLRFIGPLAIMASVIALSTLNPSNNRDVANAVHQVKEWQSENTTVYVIPEEFDLTFAYHYDRAAFSKLGKPEAPKSELTNALKAQGIHVLSDASELTSPTSAQVVCIDAHSEFLHPNNGILHKFKDEFELKDSVHFLQIFDVYLFEKK
ncbi:MAG: glycosyltransferase family 39 protein [Flavobacteriales bacterium]|nr:glycosyltransferase family 39 protein [Flavobacteriales bacterium]